MLSNGRAYHTKRSPFQIRLPGANAEIHKRRCCKQRRLPRTRKMNIKRCKEDAVDAYRNRTTQKGYRTVAGRQRVLTALLQTKDLHAADTMTYPKRTSLCTVYGQDAVYKSVRTVSQEIGLLTN